MNLKETKEGYMERFGVRKGKNDIIIIPIIKIINGRLPVF